MDKTIFSKLNNNLNQKKAYFDRQKRFYDGDTTTITEYIKELEQSIVVDIAWPKTAVDEIMSRITFDAIIGTVDGWPTKVAWDSGVPSAVDSAILNALIGACSFIAVIPNQSPSSNSKYDIPSLTVFSGAEATGTFDSVTGLLKNGLAISDKDDNGNVIDYLWFEQGKIQKIDTNGNIEEELTVKDNSVNLVPFVCQRDLASKPFGSSVLNKRARSIVAGALQLKMKIELMNLYYSIPYYFLTTDGSPSATAFTNISAKIGEIRVFANENSSKNDLTRMGGDSPKDLLSQVEGRKREFFEAVLSSSFEADSKTQEQRLSNFTYLLKRNFEIDTLNLMRAIYSTIGWDPNKFRAASIAWQNNSFIVENMGSVGDALNKISLAFGEESLMTVYGDFMKQQLGIPIHIGQIQNIVSQSSSNSGTDEGQKIDELNDKNNDNSVSTDDGISKVDINNKSAETNSKK